MDSIKRTFGLSRSSDGGPPSLLLVDSPNLSNGDPGPPLIEEFRPERLNEDAAATQVKDRIISMWNSMKFSKAFWDSKRTMPLSRHSAVWLLGLCYHKPKRPSIDEYATTPNAPEWGLSHDFHSKLWMTYRKGFECFPGTSTDTDCGWGCMIRAGQMIVSNALVQLHLGRGWRWQAHNCDDSGNTVSTGEDIYNESVHRDVVRLFADQVAAPLSIHKIVQIGQSTIQCKPGDWFGPGSTAHLLRQAVDQALDPAQEGHPQVAELLNLRIYVAMDGTVYKQDVLDLGLKAPKEEKEKPSFAAEVRSDVEGFSLVDARVGGEEEESEEDEVGEEAVFLDDEVRQYSLDQEVSVDGETWMTEEFSAPIVECERRRTPTAATPTGGGGGGWTPILVLVPVRLGGGEKVNPIYGPCVKAVLANEHCVGIIGGRPRHALYFVGFQEENLVHLDPHLVQESVDMDVADFPLASFHCRSVRKMPLSKMDPSCCLGFLCKTRGEFDAWCEAAGSFGSPDYPTFSIVEGRVSDMADSVRILNQMSIPDDDLDPLDASFPGPSSCSSPFPGAASSDSDDFVLL